MVTETGVEVVAPACFAVMLAVPAETPVTTPLGETVATDGLDDTHSTPWVQLTPEMVAVRRP